MDYEKKYKAALNWMKDVYPTLEGAAKEDVNHYFPELAESEDERIRKWLIAQLKIKIGDNATLNNMIYKAIAWLEKQGEQKPANKPQRIISAEVKEAMYDKPWSEEDEIMSLSIKQVMNCASLLNIVPEKIDKIRTWLKSLRDRVQQPQQEWSEEDEKYVKDLVDYFTGGLSLKHTEDDVANWLKSLRPQNR